MAIHGFDNIRKDIINDFEKQTDGLDLELERIISKKIADTKVDASGFQDKVLTAIRLSLRDIKKDKIDGINLAELIDINDDALKQKISKLYKDLYSEKFIDDTKLEKKFTQEIVGAIEVAKKRGITLDTPTINISNKDLSDLTNYLRETYEITDKTVDKINERLSELGISPGVSKAMDFIDSLGLDTLQKELDKVEAKASKLKNVFAEFYNRRASTSGKMNEFGFVFNATSGRSSQLEEGTATGFSYKDMKKRMKANINADSMIHFHSNELEAAFSFDDIRVAAEALKDGIVKNFVGATNNIAALDTTSLSEDLLLQVSEKLKELAMRFSPVTKDYEVDDIKAFQETKKNFADNITAFINTASAELGQDFGKELTNKFKTIDISAMPDEDVLYETLMNTMVETAKKLKITNGDKVQTAFDDAFESMSSRMAQQFQEDMLKVSFKEIAPNINFDDIYKKIPIADYQKMIDSQKGGFNPFNSEAAVKAQEKVKTSMEETEKQAKKTGDTVEQSAKQAASATEDLAKAQEDVINKQKELEKVSGNKYADIINKSFEQNNKTDYYKQLVDAYKEAQKYFGDKGIDKDKLTRDMSDAGREAGLNYINAWQQAVENGVAQSRIDKNTIKDLVTPSMPDMTEFNRQQFAEYIHEQARMLQELGNPKMTEGITAALNEYMQAWSLLQAQKLDGGLIFNESDIKAQEASLDVLKQKLIEVLSSKQQVAETPVETPKTIDDTAKAEDNLQKELNETAQAGQNAGEKITEGLNSAKSEVDKLKEALSGIILEWNQIGQIGSLDKESFSLFNSKTGYYTNPKNQGDADFISSELINSAINNAKQTVDSIIHTHPENVAAFSFDDIYAAIEEMGKGIVHQYVAGSKEVSHIDFSKLGKNTWKQIAKDFEQNFNILLKTDGWGPDTIETPELRNAFEQKVKEALKKSIAFVTGKGMDFADSIYTSTPIADFNNLEREIQAHEDLKATVQAETKAKEDATKKEDNSNTVANVENEAKAHQENESAIKAETQAKEEQKSTDNSKTISDVQNESKAHEENKTAIQAETEAKLEQKATDNSQTITQVNNETQAHVENKQAIQEETKAKKESQSSPTSEADVEHLNKLKKAAEDAKKKYNELIAKKNELLLEQASLRNVIENTAAKDGYDLAMDNARQYSLDSNKLYGLALEKSKKGSKGDVEQLGKAAAYYQLYIEALKNTDEEIKKVTVNGTNLSKKLIELAQSFGSIGSDTNTLDRLKAVNKELTAIGKQETSAKKASDKALRDYTTELNKSPVKVPITLEMSPEDEAAQNARLSALADMLFGGTSEKAQEAATSIGEVTNKLEEQKVATETAVNAEEKLAESAQKVTEAKKEEQAVTDSSAEVANAEKAAEAEKAKAEATKEATEAKQEEKALSDSTEEVANTEKAVEAEKAKVEATRESVEAKKEEKAVTDTTVETANAEKQAAAKKEEATAIHEVTDAKKEEQAVTANTQDVSVTEAKTEKLREQEAAVQGVIEAEREMAAPIATQEAQDYSALSEQLNNILQLIAKKNELFQTEATIVTSTASTESEALLNIAIALEQINGYLANISDKNINVSIKGLNSLNKLDTDKLDERLMKAWDSLDTFARGVSEIKIDDSNIVSAINNLLKDGEKLKNLATIVSSSKKDILGAANTAMNTTPDATGSVPNAKPDENIALAYQNALNSAERFYELRHMNRELTEEETKELERLWTTWDNLGKELNANIQKLEQMGKSTKNAYGFMKQYNDDAGYKAYVEKQEAAQKKAQPKEDLSKPYKEAIKEVNRYYELRMKGSNLNTEEANELQRIEGIWQQLYQNVAKTTQAIQEQGRSTQALENFSKIYEERSGAGLEAYVKKQLDSTYKPGDMSDWIQKNILASSRGDKFTEDFTKRAKELKGQLKGVTVESIISQGSFAEIEKLHQNFILLQDDAKNLNNKLVDPRKVSGLADEISKYLNQYTGLTAEFKKPLKGFLDELNSSNGKVVASRFNEIKTSVDNIKISAREAGVETKSFWTKVGEQINHTNAQMVSMYFSFYRVIGYIRQATQEVIKLDSALTELRKVSDASTERLAVSFNKSAQTAKELGSTIDSVINQTADWSRLGFSIEDSEKLARVTTMFQTVGDNMTTDTASQAMISTLKAYEMGVDDAEDIVDRYNEVANNFSIDTAGIAEAIEKSGASLKAAGNDLNESLGMIVAGNASLQNPNTVGTMLKTFSMRLRGATKSELDELGIDTTGMTDAKKSVVKQFKAMAGIDIMEGTNYKSTFQILDELHDKWEDLTDVERAALTEAVGGKRGGTVMSSLMTNWEDARAAVETAQRGMAENSGLRELENASQSIQFSLNQLKAAWQELSYDVLSSDFIKGTVDVLTKVVEGIDNVNDATHGLVPTITALGVAFSVISTFTGWTVKPIIAAFKALQGAKLADTLANIKDTASEVLLGKAKAQTALASREAEEAQLQETAAQGADINANIVQSQTEMAAATGEVAAASGEAAVSGARLGGVIGFLASPVGIAIAALAALAATIMAVHNSNENLKQSARELSDSYSSTTQDIDKFKDEISDLQEKINDSSTSYDDAKSARERLLGIQDELIEKYGTESSKIQLVTEAINGQVDALDKLSEKEWQQTKNEFNKKSGLGVGDWLNRSWRNVKNGISPWDEKNEGFIKDKIGVMNDVLNNANVHLNYGNSVDIEFISRMRQILGDDFLTGKLEKVRDNLLEIQKYAKEADISVALQNSITNEINKANDDLTSYQSMAKQVLYNDTIVQNYSSQLKEMEDAYDKYEDAIVKKNDELAAEAKDSMLDVIQGLEASNADEEVIKYFREMKPDLKKELGQMEFKADVQATIDTSEAEDAIQNVANPVGMPVIPELESDSVELEVPESPTTIPITPVLTDENGNKIASLHDFYDKQLDKNAQPVTLDVQAQSSNSQSDTSLSEQTEEFILSAEELNKAIGEFNNEEQLADFEKELESATQEQLDAYGYLAKAAEQYGLKVADLLPLLREMGMLGGIKRTGDDQFIANVMKFRGEVDYGKGIAGLKLQEQDQANMQSAMNKLSDKDREDLFSMGTERQSILADEINKAVKANDGRLLSEKQILDILNGEIEKFQEMKAAAEEVNESLSPADMAEELVEKYDKAFKAIGSAYQDMAEKEFKLDNIDWSSITAIKNEMKTIEAELSQSGISIDTTAYDHLVDVLTDTKSEASDVKAAFADLGEEIVMSLGNVDEENFQVVKSFLESKGAADACLGAFMGYANSLDETTMAAKGLTDENGNLTNSSMQAAEELVNEMYTGENTASALEYLKICLLEAAGTTISLDQQISEFERLSAQAVATGIAVREAMSLETAVRNYQGTVEKYGESSHVAKVNKEKAEAAQAEWNAALQKAKSEAADMVKLDPSKFGGKSAGGKKGGGGGGGSKKEKEEEVDVLKELSAQLDEIQAAYASLTDIVEQYNETGKLTVDQAQELINTDFHFLAMLKEENGQLKLNEQGMQDLAKAKITEMQIQLARNAIDTVNKLQTEADAINFLKYAYEGLAGATLDATEAQLKMAVAAAKARGEAQGSAEMVKAAESIYQGYLATKQAIGNTDFSKESLKGDQKDKTKETKDKDKSKDKEEEEETKTRFNWLDQLVNNIQRTIDRLSKRAEKYFSYMEKNAMVDKQIAANRRMINTQEVASAYYSSKAGKALKKVPKKYRKLVSGDFDAATVKKLYADVGEKGTKKLNEYLEWKQLRDESQDKLADAYDKERELIASKMDNILSYFDTLIGYQQNIVSGIEASMKLDTAKGLKTNINNIIAAYGREKEIVEKSGEREAAYRQEAAGNTEAIRNSYQNQISQTQTGYQNTADFQKLKNKGKQGKAKSTLQGGYEVLEEDISAAIEAAKKLNSKKSKKQAEGRAVLESLHQKYLNRVAELEREAAEAEAANQAKLADQIQQNETMTKEAEIAKWERMKSVLEEMGKVYDSQISQLGTLIDKYETLADLLKSVDASTIAKYNVNDIFGLTGNGDNDRKSFIQKSIESTKSMIEEYKKQYALYGDIVNAMEGSASERQQKFLDILKKNNLDASSKKIVEDLAKELAGNNWEGNEYLAQYKQMMSEIVSSIAKSIKQIEDYSDELADSVTKATQKMIDALRLLQDAYASKASLINDAWVVDVNGMTNLGYAKISALSQEMDVARQRAEQFRQQIADIERAGVGTYGSQDEYDEARNTAIKNYYEALQTAYSVQNDIYEIAKKVAQVEVDNVSKLVENYKKALNSKKAYYDYDKTLKDKNKNIQALKAEEQALQNVGDAASKARLKAIQAELKEAQEDLDDTVFEHSIQVETDALDKLVEDLTQALDTSAKTIQETFEEFARTVSAVLAASNGVNSDAIYNDLIGFIMNGKSTGVMTGTAAKINTTKSNASTVSGDMKNGTLMSLSEKSLDNINANVLNILNKQKELFNLQNNISNASNYLPNISTQVNKISTNVETISKNTTSIAKELSTMSQMNQQRMQIFSRMAQRYGYYDWDYLYKQLRKLGITRWY